MIEQIDPKGFQKLLLGKKLLIEKALVFNLEALVSQLQNHAKESAGYKDDTGNLKSSIGGVVLKDGRPISYRGFDGKAEGISEGKSFINELIGQAGPGYVIIVVAGMEYASYVEDYHNLNVLKLTEFKMNIELPKMIEKLKQRF